MGAARKEAMLYRSTRAYPFLASLFMAWSLGTWAWAVDPQFAEINIGSTGGGGQGQTSMLDVDLDGDLDWLVATKESALFFWEFKGKDAAGAPQWAMHKVGDFAGKGAETSGKAFDITGDGYPDHIGGSVWFENPGKAGVTGAWKRHDNNGVDIWGADAILGDFNHDGNMDVAFIQKGDPSAWFDIPRSNPRGPWVQHVWPGIQIHSGLAAGDLNGDGFLDAVVGNIAFLTRNKEGTAWDQVTLPYDKRGADGVLIEVGDVDGDGDMDVIEQPHWSSGDNTWVENDGTGKNWTRHVVGKCETRGHSANIADIDNDGDPDFELGEDGGRSRWYLNEGNRKFREMVFTSKPTHDMRAGDVDMDGDIDMMAKPWGGGDHWYIENILVDKGGPKRDWKRGPMGSHNPMNPNRPKRPGCMDPRSPHFDLWALHDGPLNQGCTGVTLTRMKTPPHATRKPWALAFAASGLDWDLPAYRLDGSGLSAVEAAHPRGRMVVGKSRRE